MGHYKMPFSVECSDLISDTTDQSFLPGWWRLRW